MVRDERRPDLPGFRFWQHFAGGTSTLVGIYWAQDGHTLTTAAEDLTITQWNRHTKSAAGKFVVRDMLGRLSCCLPRPGGDILLASSGENAIHTYQLASGARLSSLFGHNARVSDLCMTDDGRYVISASQDNTVKVWGLGQITLLGHTARVNAVVAIDCGTAASGADDSSVRVWNLSTGEALHVLREHQGRVTALAACPDGELIASGSDDRGICIWTVGSGKLFRALEGHTDTITGLKFSEDGGLLASHGADGMLYLWRTDTWERIAAIDMPAGAANTSHLIAFHPELPALALPTADGMSVDLWELDHRALVYPHAEHDSVQYTTARVALVGDSGVGKTALGFRMVHGHFAETEPTHGQQFWSLDKLGKIDEDGGEREVVLWDFAGQSDYRLIHTLFLDDIDVALILFDGGEFDEPMRGVEYWLRQLARPVKKILVGGRLDRGEPPLTDKDLEAFCRYHGIEGGYVGTSAVTGKGIDDLLDRIRQHIDWQTMPPTTTTATFRRIKSFVLELKADPLWQRALIRPDELRQRLEALDAAWVFSDDELMTAVRHLQNHGYVTLLDGPDLEPTLLLRPELLIKLASSFVMQARHHPRGLGALEEEALLRGDYAFPELDGLSATEAETLREAAMLLLLENHLCIREHSDERTLLIFPALINRKHPHLKHVNVIDDVSYRVSGAVANVYASLVVQLTYTRRFTSTHHWQNQAQFQMGVGEICGFRLEEVEDGEVDLVLYYGADVPDYTRAIFQELFEKFLKSSNVAYTRYQPMNCPRCRHLQERSVVARRIQEDSNYLHCVECGAFIDLRDTPLPTHNLQELEQEQRQSQMRTAFELALVRIKSMAQEDKRTPSIFISYAWGSEWHRLWVRRLVGYLEQADIKVIWDQAHTPQLGHTLSRFVEQIETVDYIIVVGTPLYLDKYVNEKGSVVAAEADLINLRLVGTTESEKEKVLPVLLDGDGRVALPPLLRTRVFADFRQEQFYFLNLFKLIYTLFGFSSADPVIDKLQTFMRGSVDEVK